MKRAVVQNIKDLAVYRHRDQTYDATKLGLADLMVKRSGPTNENNWAGPMESNLPFLHASATGGGQTQFVWAMRWSNTATSKIDWVFMSDSSSASTSRRVYMATFNRITGDWTYLGYVNVNHPSGTNATVRGIRMTYDLYTTGTVAVSGTAVTGTSTTWTTSRVPAGCRIGFGSTDPTQITQWYEISAIGSNTGLTLALTAGTISAGTPYVIEDLRCVMGHTNSVGASGGLFLVKGLMPELFNPTGTTTITAATTVDSVRACYWLKETTGTSVITTAAGLGLEPATDYTNQNCWISIGTTTIRLFKFNIRAALTLTSGATASAYLLATATSATLAGTATQSNNGRVVNPSHGPGAGVACFYFTTSTRIYRTKALSAIADGDTTFITAGDVQLPIWPTGNPNMFSGTVPGGLQSLEYSAVMDILFVPNSLSGQNRTLVTKYRTDGAACDRVMLNNDHGLYAANPASIAATGVSEPTATGSLWVEGGLLYLVNNSTTNGAVWVVPVGVDWEYPNTELIFPKMTLTGVDKITGVDISTADSVGTLEGYNTALPTNPHRIKYRTSGIDDNSGAWVDCDRTGILNLPNVTTIQFAVEFRTIGLLAQCDRVYSLTMVYDDLSADDHYQFSFDHTVPASKRFAWRHAVAFGATVPYLNVRLIDAVTGNVLVNDNTQTPSGTWERSTNNGSSWSAFSSTDKGNETTYIRYTPTSLADGVSVLAVLGLQ